MVNAAFLVSYSLYFGFIKFIYMIYSLIEHVKSSYIDSIVFFGYFMLNVRCSAFSLGFLKSLSSLLETDVKDDGEHGSIETLS